MSKGICPFYSRDCSDDCALFIGGEYNCCSFVRLPSELTFINDAIVAQGEVLTNLRNLVNSVISHG
jgi:hypothetical protein